MLLDCQCALACIFLDIDRKVLDHCVDFSVIRASCRDRSFSFSDRRAVKMSALRTIVIEDGRFEWLTAFDQLVCSSTKASFVTEWIMSAPASTTPMAFPYTTSQQTSATSSPTPTLPVVTAQRVLTSIPTPVIVTDSQSDLAPTKAAVGPRPRRSSRIVTRSALKRTQVEKENNDDC